MIYDIYTKVTDLVICSSLFQYSPFPNYLWSQVVVDFLEIFSKVKLKIEIFFKVVGAGEDPRQLGAAGEDRPQPLHRLQSGRVVGARGEGPHGLSQV